MTTFNFKRFLVGASAAAALAVPGIALADPTCVYVIGEVNSVTVSTPAVIIPVPDTEATVQPVRVHLDETEQNIVGYSVRTPGVDEGTDPKTVFVPGTEVTINPIVATTPELPLQAHRCVNQTVSTPAIPVYIPESVLTTPGAVLTVPAIELNILNQPVTTAGKVIELPSKTIVIPAFETAVPGVSVTTPDQTIVVNFSTGGTLESAAFMVPTSP
jgi:hypothetical protein